MPADRLLVKLSAEAAAERKRCDDLATHLGDSLLESRGRLVGSSDVKHFLGRMSRELFVLAAVIRDGGDAAELESRLAALGPRSG